METETPALWLLQGVSGRKGVVKIYGVVEQLLYFLAAQVM